MAYQTTLPAEGASTFLYCISVNIWVVNYDQEREDPIQLGNYSTKEHALAKWALGGEPIRNQATLVLSRQLLAKHFCQTLANTAEGFYSLAQEGCMRIFVSQSISFCQGSFGVLSLTAIFCRWMEGKREKEFFFHLHRWYSFLAVVMSANSEQYSAAVSLLWSPTSNGTMATCKDVLSA